MIILKGRIPSKKNSRWIKIIRGVPISLPSKKYKDWHKDASWQLKEQRVTAPPFSVIKIVIYAPDKRAADLTNKAESIMDLLTDNEVIADDNWFEVPEILLRFGGVDKENPRATVEFI